MKGTTAVAGIALQITLCFYKLYGELATKLHKAEARATAFCCQKKGHSSRFHARSWLLGSQKTAVFLFSLRIPFLPGCELGGSEVPAVMQGKEGTGMWEERGRAVGPPLLQGVATAALEKGWRG